MARVALTRARLGRSRRGGFCLRISAHQEVDALLSDVRRHLFDRRALRLVEPFVEKLVAVLSFGEQFAKLRALFCRCERDRHGIALEDGAAVALGNLVVRKRDYRIERKPIEPRLPHDRNAIGPATLELQHKIEEVVELRVAIERLADLDDLRSVALPASFRVARDDEIHIETRKEVQQMLYLPIGKPLVPRERGTGR